MQVFKSLLALSLFLPGVALNAQCPTSRQTGHHIVRRGENLFRIARQHRISVADLCTWNHLDENAPLSVCTDLVVNGPRERVVYASAMPEHRDPQPYRLSQNASVPQTYSVVAMRHVRQHGGTHMVRPGETLGGLAALYGYTEQRFREINQLDASSDIAPGMVLRTTHCTCPPKIIQERKPVQVSTASMDYYDQDEHLVPVSTMPKNGVVADADPMNTPAPGYTYMTRREYQMIEEVNTLRANPAGYIKYVEDYVRDMRQNGEFGNSIQTSQELMEVLKNTKPLPVLTPIECLHAAAVLHAQDQKPTGDVNHQGTDGAMPWDRTQRACSLLINGNENLVGGPASIRRAVLLLLIDDGIEGRGHRKNLLNPEWQYVACHKVGTVGTMSNYWIQMFGM